jgi:transposase
MTGRTVRADMSEIWAVGMKTPSPLRRQICQPCARVWGDVWTTRFVQGEDREQNPFVPRRWDVCIGENDPVRVINVFVAELDPDALGFQGMQPRATGRPPYDPSTLLKIYLYGYLNRIQSSRRLERETQRNVEVMWLTGRLMPDFKTIADFRKNNDPVIRFGQSPGTVFTPSA